VHTGKCYGDVCVPEQTIESQAGITQDQNHITIVTEPLYICYPPADVVKVRSAKCLFLWHCNVPGRAAPTYFERALRFINYSSSQTQGYLAAIAI